MKVVDLEKVYRVGGKMDDIGLYVKEEDIEGNMDI